MTISFQKMMIKKTNSIIIMNAPPGQGQELLVRVVEPNFKRSGIW